MNLLAKMIVISAIAVSMSACSSIKLNGNEVLYSRIHTVDLDLTPTGCEVDCIHSVTFRLICLSDGITASMNVMPQEGDVFDQLTDAGKWMLHQLMMERAESACDTVWEDPLYVKPDTF